MRLNCSPIINFYYSCFVMYTNIHSFFLCKIYHSIKHFNSLLLNSNLLFFFSSWNTYSFNPFIQIISLLTNRQPTRQQRILLLAFLQISYFISVLIYLKQISLSFVTAPQSILHSLQWFFLIDSVIFSISLINGPLYTFTSTILLNYTSICFVDIKAFAVILSFMVKINRI